ncbi:hypothetical protein [Bradyrhizobium sp. USDA 4473]
MKFQVRVDALTESTLSEVKNVGSLSYIQQLRDFTTYIAKLTVLLFSCMFGHLGSPATSDHERPDKIEFYSGGSMKSKPPKSAAELMSRLQNDPEWVRDTAKREAEHRAAIEQRREEIRPEQTPILAELGSIGIKVDSIWDLVNAKWSYPAAIPVLSKYLQQVHHPLLREGIARALTVPEARGSAGHVILAELQRPYDQSTHAERWVLANALTVVADEAMAGTIESLIANDDYADVRERLITALRKLR